MYRNEAGEKNKVNEVCEKRKTRIEDKRMQSFRMGLFIGTRQLKTLIRDSNRW